MLNVNVNEKKYAFPTIDFKLQNSGNATAFLWKFVIHVMQAKIDMTPVLEFKAEVLNGALEIEVINNGWGTAHTISLQIDEIDGSASPYLNVPDTKIPKQLQTLNRLFGPTIHQFRDTVQSGQHKKIFRLEKNLVDPDQFEAVRKEFTNLNAGITSTRVGTNITREAEPFIGTRIGTMYVHWTCEDDNGIQQKGTSVIQHSDFFDFMVLTPDGFEERLSFYDYAPMMTSSTYVSIIDPISSPQELLYPISHKIPPGDVERFHILVGALKSCSLLIQFNLFVDQATIIASKPFHIHIWSPRGFLADDGLCQSTRDGVRYLDGTQINREIERLQQEVANGYSWHQNKIEKLQKVATSAPFITIEKERADEM